MKEAKNFDVIIIGGSYAGLSAAMALGRSLRRVLIIDSGKPCNQQTPHSHNFITQDGQTPKQIADKAKEQVLAYNTVKFFSGTAVSGNKTEKGFQVTTTSGETFYARKLLFTTGVVDEMPAIPGFAECWGISVLHCPYCHGYEVKGETIGLLANGDMGYEFCKHISNWSKNLILFTNGKSTLTTEQTQTLANKGFKIIQNEIDRFEHQNGNVENVVFQDGSKQKVTAIFARPTNKQHCDIPMQLGCSLTENGLVQIDNINRTTVAGVFAAGDNTSAMRAVSMVTAAGTMAGVSINKELIDEYFY